MAVVFRSSNEIYITNKEDNKLKISVSCMLAALFSNLRQLAAIIFAIL
jgi:hypothetical protein